MLKKLIFLIMLLSMQIVFADIKDIKDGDQLKGIYYCKEKKELRRMS